MMDLAAKKKVAGSGRPARRYWPMIYPLCSRLSTIRDMQDQIKGLGRGSAASVRPCLRPIELRDELIGCRRIDEAEENLATLDELWTGWKRSWLRLIDSCRSFRALPVVTALASEDGYAECPGDQSA